MMLIKRYPNRKLYNTRDKCYITLDQLAKLIHKGEEIQVVDYLSGEDLTSLTLTQIIFELEKNKAGSLPRNILANIIRFTAEANPLKGIFSANEGESADFDEEIKSRIALLEAHDFIDREGAAGMGKLLIEVYHSLADSEIEEFTQQVKKVLENRHIPTRTQINQLQKQLENLAQEVDGLINRQY